MSHARNTLMCTDHFELSHATDIARSMFPQVGPDLLEHEYVHTIETELGWSHIFTVQWSTFDASACARVSVDSSQYWSPEQLVLRLIS